LEPAPYFDDRESFAVAEAAVAVIRRRCRRFPDDDAVWDAFIAWRGRGEREYLQRIRAGGKFIFYSALHDLYRFAEEVCGEPVTRAIGQELTEAVLARHMPDILQTTLRPTGSLSEQILGLVEQVVANTCGEVYELSVAPRSQWKRLPAASIRGRMPRLLSAWGWPWRSEPGMEDYLERCGQEADRVGAVREPPLPVLEGLGHPRGHGLVRDRGVQLLLGGEDAHAHRPGWDPDPTVAGSGCGSD